MAWWLRAGEGHRIFLGPGACGKPQGRGNSWESYLEELGLRVREWQEACRWRQTSDICFRATVCATAESISKWCLNLGHLFPVPGFTYFLPVSMDWQNRSYQHSVNSLESQSLGLCFDSPRTGKIINSFELQYPLPYPPPKKTAENKQTTPPNRSNNILPCYDYLKY